MENWRKVKEKCKNYGSGPNLIALLIKWTQQGHNLAAPPANQRLKNVSYKLQNAYSCHFQFRQTLQQSMATLFPSCVFLQIWPRLCVPQVQWLILGHWLHIWAQWKVYALTKSVASKTKHWPHWFGSVNKMFHTKHWIVYVFCRKIG